MANKDEPVKQLSNSSVVLTSLVAGATAGALAKTAIAPLDRTKITFQMLRVCHSTNNNIGKTISEKINNKRYSTKAAFRFIRASWRNDGLLSLWRGNSATMARIIPHAAVQFTAHEQWKRVLQIDAAGGQLHATKKKFLAGSLAGLTSQSLTYPLDLARARMAVSDKGVYDSLAQVFVKIYRNEGIVAFYKGYWATVLGVIPYAGVSFYTYGALQTTTESNFGTRNAVTNLVCGAVAGALGQTSSYPLDIVRRRMQTSAITGKPYTTIGQTLVTVYSEEGVVRGLYKGLSMNWIKGPIAVGISFATYDHIKDYTRSFLIQSAA